VKSVKVSSVRYIFHVPYDSDESTTLYVKF
jgi:hypothetical protein